MAIYDAYATVPQYRNSSAGKLDSADDDMIALHLLAISRLFEARTHQFFGVDSTAVARVWYGKGTTCLEVWGEGGCPGIAPVQTNDVWGPQTITIKVDTDLDGSFADETAWADSDYQLWPLSAHLGPEPKPYDRIVIPRWSTKSSFPSGYPVQVTAKYGYGEVPSGVWADTIELCGIWRGENPRSTGRMQELDQVVSTSPMANALVKRFEQAYANPAAVIV